MKRISTLFFVCTLLLFGLPFASKANFGNTAISDPSSIVKYNGVYHVFGTGNQITHLTSTDLVNWTSAATVFTTANSPTWMKTALPTFAGNFWAPEITNINGTFYLYYSCSVGGKPAAIGLATSTNLTTWTDKGMVVSSDNNSPYTTVDPSVFADANNNYWLTFGSHYNGIYITQLNATTGKPVSSAVTNIAGTANGDQAASFVTYNQGYYYLFFGVGVCCNGVNSTTSVKVGRSSNPTGPYTDKAGTSLLSGGGTTVLATSGKYIGPTQFGLLKEGTRNVLSMHYYDRTTNGTARLDVASLTFGSDGWPVATRDLMPNGRYRIVNKNSNLTWESQGCTGSEGQKLIQNTPSATALCQQWDLTSVGDGFYQLKNANGGPNTQVVDIPNCNTNNGTLLATWGWLNNDCQKFKIEQAANGAYVFSPAANAARTIEVPFASLSAGQQLGLWDFNGCTCQQWAINAVPVPDATVANAPTNVTTTSFTASWTPVANVSTYQLDVATSASFTSSSFVSGYNNLTVAGTSQTVTGLLPSGGYFYRVRAVSNGITSTNSNVASTYTTGVVDNGIHDPGSIVKEGAKYWMYGTGFNNSDGSTVPLTIASSTDLIKWTRGTKSVFAPGTWPSWISAAVPNFGGIFWAPEIIYMNGLYYLYYSASAFGSPTSVIGLATSPTLDQSSPDYAWTDRGMVVSSNSSAQVNAIDPAVLKDTDGRLWLSYGSFSAGIAVVELDPATGLKKAGATNTIVAGGSSAAWEAPYIVKEGSYYYLFVNRQACCKLLNSTYYVVVGRSTSITGPYVDKNGNSLLVASNNEVVGTTVLESSSKFIGPGHIGLLREGDRNIISTHYYDGTSNGYPRLDLATLKFSNDGWPIITRDVLPQGRYRLTNKASNLVWETAGCTGGPGQQLVQNTANDDALCQLWDLTPVGDGFYQLKNANAGANTQVVDVPFCDVNNKLATYNWLNNDCQKFRIDKLTNGNYVVSPYVNGSVFIDVPSSSTAPNTQLGLTAFSGNLSQQWSIELAQTAPLAIAASEVTPGSFQAKWTAVPNADGYKVDVYTAVSNAPVPATTIAGWNFENGTSAASSGIDANKAKTITTSGTGAVVYNAAGNGGLTAKATGWDNGNVTKYWEAANLSTKGYYGIKVASKQRSNLNGPRHFKLQYKIGAGTYADVPGSYVTTADNYSSGIITNIQLPAICDNQSSLSLRWLMMTNTAVSGNATTADGESNIDDIVITAVNSPSYAFVQGYDDVPATGTSLNITGLSANTSYYYRVRSIVSGGTSANSNAIAVKTTCQIVTPNETLTQVTCNGANNGKITLAVDGGTTPYSYSWTGPNSFTSKSATLENLATGDYNVTITQANGCTSDFTYTITEPAVLKAAAAAGTITCYGGTTTITISAEGGKAPYDGTGTFTVKAGTYSYTVTDANGCSTTVTKTVSEPAALMASVKDGIIKCHGGTTTISVSATGGTAPYKGTGDFTVSAGPYSYTVTDAAGCSTVVSGTITEPAVLNASADAGTIACHGGITTVSVNAIGGTAPYQGTGSFTVTAGTYSYTVTDANGCAAAVTITVSEPDVLTAAAEEGTIGCNGGTTTVTIKATGGTAPYKGIGTFTVSAGTYNFTVTDANGCSTTISGIIAEPPVLTAAATEGAILCNGGTTTVKVTASGGTAPHTGTGIFTVKAGAYSYTITDAKGCSATVSGTITEPPVLSATAVAGTIACNGGTTTITVSADGGTAPYKGTGSFTVTAGTYTYTVTDANGCSTIVSKTITEPEVLTATANAGTIKCNGGTTTITVSALGGTAPYKGTGTFTVGAGPYSFTITDASGCSSTVNGSVSQPAVLTASAAASVISCNGGTTSLVVTASGGTAPYSGTGIYAVHAGAYSYTVTDANGCTATVKGSIGEPTVLKANITNNNPQLYFGYIGDQTAILSATASGGTAPYKIVIGMNRPLKCNVITDEGDEVWSAANGATINNACPAYPGGNTAAPVSSISGLAAGEAYAVNATLMDNALITITVTDANGCSKTVTTQVWAEDVRCLSGNSGNAKVTLCHRTGNAKTPCVKICVDQSNVDEHLAHGDYLGNCTPDCVPPANTYTTFKRNGNEGAATEATPLELRVSNNPSYRFQAFRLAVFSGNRRDGISLRILDATGKLLMEKQNLHSGQTIEAGSAYVQGVYYAEVVQGTARKVVKLIKQ